MCAMYLYLLHLLHLLQLDYGGYNLGSLRGVTQVDRHLDFSEFSINLVHSLLQAK